MSGDEDDEKPAEDHAPAQEDDEDDRPPSDWQGVKNNQPLKKLERR